VKRFVVGVMVAILLTPTLQALFPNALIGYVDDVSCVLTLVVVVPWALLRRRPLQVPPGTGWFALYVAAGAVSTVVRGVPLELGALGGYLFIKGPLLYFCVAQLNWTGEDVRKLARVGVRVAIMVLVCCLINIVMPGAWGSKFSPEAFDHRGGAIPTITGPFPLPGDLAQAMVLLSACCAVVLMQRGGSAKVKAGLLLAGSVVANLLTFRRITLVALFGSLLVVVRFGRRAKVMVAIPAVLGLTLVTILSWGHIVGMANEVYQQYWVNPLAARTLLYRDSFSVANGYFPTGAGFSRYGSYLSGQHYSPEYIRLGFESIEGLGVGTRGLYFTDTFWPAILGEAGWVGLIGYSLAIWRIGRVGRLLARRSDPVFHAAGLILASWSLGMVIDSFVAPIYSSPPNYGVIFGFAGVVAALTRSRPSDDACDGFSSAPVERNRPRPASRA
jgi:hypothetical protein